MPNILELDAVITVTPHCQAYFTGMNISIRICDIICIKRAPGFSISVILPVVPSLHENTSDWLYIAMGVPNIMLWGIYLILFIFRIVVHW